MKPKLNCAIYTRKSSEEGLEQDFNSLHAQREACAAFILSQKAEGWHALSEAYDDGGYSGGNLERPALHCLMQDIAAGKVKIIVVYKVDRLTRSLTDFAKLVEQFDARGVSFVSVTQQFNTTSSMGRLTLNVLLSFAQFEREVTGERIRDKIAASKQKGMWMGGIVPIGYRSHERTLVIDEPQAETIRCIYDLYLEHGCVRQLKTDLDARGWVTPVRKYGENGTQGGRPFSRGHLYRILTNPIYLGQIAHKDLRYEGLHPAIIDQTRWDRVQAALALNRQGNRDRASDKARSLLAGRVFDQNDERLIPTHACKGSRRYRYYISQCLIGTVKSEAANGDSTGLRIPAQELEGVVKQILIGYLNDPPRILADLGQPDADTCQAAIRRANQLRDTLTQGSSREQIAILEALIERVTVSRDQLAVKVNPSALVGDASAGTDITLTLPVRFRRCGFGIRLIIPTQQGTQSGAIDVRLVNFVRRGIGWFRRMVTEGIGPSVIAQSEQLSPPLVQQMIYVAFLAPDIVTAIESGTQPATLTAHTLFKALPLPACWEEQRRLLGVESSMK
ncbi:MAG: hin1 [Proteobacteria bacterium]|nr:hin1 [Pseudomonadota bacterium]